MTTFKLSPSSLGLFEECPRCFWLNKHGIWKRPETPFPQLPNGMDRVIKTHFDKFRDKGLLPPELCENNACKGMNLFSDKELLAMWRNNFEGIGWEDKKGNILFGAMDNILVKGKKLIVLDYKTRGTAVRDDTAAWSQRQLNIYNLLLRKNGYSTEDYSFLLFYYPKEILESGDFIFYNELIKVKINPSDGEKVFKKALKLLNGNCPKKSCEWCDGK